MKFINTDVDECLDEALRDLGKLYFTEFETDYLLDLNLELETSELKERIVLLEKELDQDFLNMLPSDFNQLKIQALHH